MSDVIAAIIPLQNPPKNVASTLISPQRDRGLHQIRKRTVHTPIKQMSRAWVSEQVIVSQHAQLVYSNRFEDVVMIFFSPSDYRVIICHKNK